MKLNIFVVLVGTLAIFIGLSFLAPKKTEPEAVQVDILNTIQTDAIEDELINTEEMVTEEPLVKEVVETEEMLIVEAEKEVETVIKISDIVEPIVEKVVEDTFPNIEKAKEVSFLKTNEITREALVNIFCTTKSGGSFKPITGSGIVIDERGIILTNAHVAQYYLLKDYLVNDFVNCVIRTGSPAKSLYKAELVFISPSWISVNSSNIIEQNPKGTGEDDYALLRITERTDPNKALPEQFPFIKPLYTSDVDVGDNVLLAAYPAGFLSGITISKDLYISSAITKIIEVFTFKGGTLDLFSIGGSVVAQQGSSGGAVVDIDNKLLGIIVTSSTADNTKDRDLRAITIAHINRSFVKDTGFDLQTFLSGNIEAEADAFNENIAPNLTQLLVDELEK